MAQVPPPPQALGRKIFASLRVLNSVPPAATSSVFSPLMVTFTRPLGESFALANNSSATSSSVTVRKTARVMRIVEPMSVRQILMPMKLMKAMPMSPVMMNVMPSPFRGAGTWL